MDEKTVAARVLESGETTSEHAVMTQTTASSKVLLILGSILAIGSQATDALNWLPESVRNSKYGVIGITVIGAILGVIAIIKDTMVKVSYVNGRSLIKAAAVKDVAPSTSLDTAAK